MEMAPDGKRRKSLRYEALGEVTKKQASDTLAQRLAAAGSGKAPTRSRMTFRTLAGEWDVSVLPKYKHSTQKHRRFMLKKHLLPRFGDRQLSEVTRQEIQGYVAHLTRSGYAPKSIDHIHDVLSAVLRTAVKWGHLPENPARGVDLPTLTCVRPKWVPTTIQAAALLNALPSLPRTMVGLAILSGLRRGELFALRWKDIDEHARLLTVREAVYDGMFSTPKTRAGSRQIPLSDTAQRLVVEWKALARTTEPEALVFSTRQGKLISPNNVLRRSIFPVCKQLGLPHATLFIVVSRQRGARQGGRSAHGPQQRRYDVERVHAGARRLSA
jgi:integrase